MSREQQRDLFQIQARLFREFQLKFELTAKKCAEIFAKYNLYDYIRDCYEEYHVQGDEANLADLEDLLLKKGWKQSSRDNRIKSLKTSKHENCMMILAMMSAENIAKEQKISKTKAYSKFMTSKTGEMLFDESTGLWMNGPDYLANEYKIEMARKR